ncbi:HTH domain-containing protein [Methanobrevibacter sp. DSM 116169]
MENSLNYRQNEVLIFLNKKNNSISIKQYSKMFNISRSTSIRDIRVLLNLNMVRKIKFKGQRETFYIINK